MSSRSHQLQTPDGLRLHVYDHGAEDAARTLVLVHGYGEHGGRYAERAARFVQAGWRVLVPDQRGHGRSEGQRGHVLRFEQYLEDLQQVFGLVRTDRARTVLAGHSNGGLIVARQLERSSERFCAAALTSPFLGLAIQAPPLKLAAGRLISRILPKFSLPTEIRPADLSHDPAVVAAYEVDPLGHKVVNTRWFTEATAAQQAALTEAARVDVPVLVLQGGDDRIADPAASRRWAQAAPAHLVRYEEVPGAFHELLFEIEGAQHAERLLAFFDEHCRV